MDVKIKIELENKDMELSLTEAKMLLEKLKEVFEPVTWTYTQSDFLGKPIT